MFNERLLNILFDILDNSPFLYYFCCNDIFDDKVENLGNILKALHIQP